MHDATERFGLGQAPARLGHQSDVAEPPRARVDTLRCDQVGTS